MIIDLNLGDVLIRDAYQVCINFRGYQGGSWDLAPASSDFILDEVLKEGFVYLAFGAREVAEAIVAEKLRQTHEDLFPEVS